MCVMEGFCSIYQQKCVQLQVPPLKAILALFENASRRGVAINHIDLSYKSLDSKAVIPLSAALGFNITITQLNLSYNLIEKRGCKAIAAVLRTNTSLTWLDMSGNKMGDEGVKHLAEALAENATLVTLILKNNNIRDVGACDIASSLTVNASLKELDISQNIIQATGGEALATALTHNTTLERLNLANTKLPQTALYALSLHVGKGGLKQLDLRGNASGNPQARLYDISKQLHQSTNIMHTTGKASYDFMDFNTGNGNDKNVEEQLLSLASSLRRDISLLEGDDDNKGDSVALRLESLTQAVEGQLGASLREPLVQGGPQNTPATVETLRQLNNQYSTQISKLQHQLKSQTESHRRRVDHLNSSVAGSEQNLREIIMEMKESMNRMERELVEKSKKNVAIEHEMERANFNHEQALKSLQTTHAERMRKIRAKSQEQYDQLCQDYQDYKKKSTDEFMALSSDFEANKKQGAVLQQQNLKLAASLEEHKQLVAQLQQQVADLTIKAQHASDLQRQLAAADTELVTKQEVVRTKDEELVALRADNDKLAYWLKSMQKAVVDVSRAEGKSTSPIRNSTSKQGLHTSTSVAPPTPTVRF